MRILWVPHTSAQPGVRARADYLIERLQKEHDLHVLCWDVPIRRTASGLLSAMASWTKRDGPVVYHHLPRVPLPFNGRRPWLTEAIFQRLIRKLVRDERIDVVVCSCNWYALGHPPLGLPVPLVIDYFDLLQDQHEAWYLTHADAVLSSSLVLHERAGRFDIPSYYIPNGVDVGLFRNADGQTMRRELGVGDSPVVSLIGVTASPRLYFIEAIELAARDVPGLKGLIVGAGPMMPAVRARLRGHEARFQIVGPVAFDRIPSFFAASDVGLYPGDALPHFDAALPIKVLEYSAAGKPVVAPPLDELKRLALPNVIFAEPTAEGFAEGIKQALRAPTAVPDLTRFEIDRVSRDLVSSLKEIMVSWRLDTRSARAMLVRKQARSEAL